MGKCKKCLYEDSHPFGMSYFDGLCLGCYTHLEKYNLYWEDRYEQLFTIAKKAKKSSKNYDCIIPITGDAEDFFVTSEVLKLGLNPLLVSVNSYFLNDIGWKNLHSLITYFDLDSWVYNPDIETYKNLIRTSLRKYNHMNLPWLQLHTSFPVHVAKEKNIPLIIWGANQAIEQVGKFSHLDNVEMSSWSRVEHDLFGNDINTLIGTGAEVSERKLSYYKYPEIKKLGGKIRGIYLSNFIPWDPLKQNHSMLRFGFTPELNYASFDPYERAGSSVYYQIHDLLKFERLGYRKIIDHCTREIRHGRISRDEATNIANLYENNKVNIKPFFDWLGVTKSGMEWFILHKLKNSHQLIAENKEQVEKNIILPIAIQNLIKGPVKSSEQFIKYGKGINID